jgi:uncharacterized protein YbaR (Trm112 family)
MSACGVAVGHDPGREGYRVSIDPRLLEILVCPACRGEIEPRQDESGLECRRCGRVYPVRDGIPVMLVNEASAPTRDIAVEQPDPGTGRRDS